MGPASSTCATAGWPAIDLSDRPAHAIDNVTLLLVADDGVGVDHLSALLAASGYHVDTHRSADSVLDAIEACDFDAVIVDGPEAFGERDLIAEIVSRDPAISIVVTSSDASLTAEAIGRGAHAFVETPTDIARLAAAVGTSAALSRARRRVRRLEAETEALRPVICPMLVADAPAMKPVVDRIARVAGSDVNVLLTGESGTGKATVAQAIHALSARSRGPFITVPVSAVTASEIESVMFGRAGDLVCGDAADAMGRFELAEGGTLFIEEIAALPMTAQSALLRAVETGEFTPVGSSRTRRAAVRVISSTTVDPSAAVACRQLRQDLLLRLGTVEIALPPLRERREDIPALAHQFLRRHARAHRRAVSGFEHEAMQSMLMHPWPGNIREIDHAVERAVLRAEGTAARLSDLGLEPISAAVLDDMSLEQVEAFLIVKALARAGRNVSQAAKALGLSRSALYRRLQRYGL